MRRLTAALCAVALTAACTSDDPQVTPIEPDGEASATETEDTSTPATETDDEDPFAVPDEIDDAYVQAVIDELFARRTEAIELTIAAADGDQLDPPDEAAFLNDAIHDGPQRGQFGESLFEINNAANLDEIVVPEDEREGERFTVELLVLGEPSCVLAVGDYDRTRLLRNTQDDRFFLATLHRANGGDDRNPTPWRLRQINPVLDDDDEPLPLTDIRSIDDDDWEDAIDRFCEGADG